MSDIINTTNVIVFISAAFATVISNMFYYYRGYSKGHKDGLAYGAKGLQEYHEYTMNNIQQMRNDVKRI